MRSRRSHDKQRHDSDDKESHQNTLGAVRKLDAGRGDKMFAFWRFLAVSREKAISRIYGAGLP
jgi:hypothetical protein